MLLEALSKIEGGDSRQRCRILSALGRAFLMKGNFERADVFNSEAIEMARRLKDDRSLCEVLLLHFWCRPHSRGHNPRTCATASAKRSQLPID
jgi:ATP/maltotriose-dependent transcriptional regulator MalT